MLRIPEIAVSRSWEYHSPILQRGIDAVDELFAEAALKIERAEKHINDLNRIIGDFVGTANYVVFVDRDRQTGNNLMKVRAIKTLSPHFPLVLGDALHNLRTALDYAMNEIEAITTGRRTNYTKFPIYETADGLKAAVNGGFKQKAPKQVIECIEDVIQPYRGGNGDALWCLHELDIRDKHQLLIPNMEFTDISGIRFKDDRGTEHMVDSWRVIDLWIAEVPITGTDKVEITDQGSRTFFVTFSHGLPFGGAEIVPTLCNLAEFVRYVLAEVKHSFILSQI
jgi:hypothetical protein